MVTEHSVDLTRINEPCFARVGNGKTNGCAILMYMNRDDCNTYRCPFYKPAALRSWIRIEDGTGINLIPPEELKKFYY